MAFKTDGARPESKMSLSRRVMAHRALGNGLYSTWQVLNMAVKTGDCCSMLAAGPFDVGGL